MQSGPSGCERGRQRVRSWIILTPLRPPLPLSSVRDEIIACKTCPRLRQFCERIGREKRAAFRQETYWARPVPGFGDPAARIVLVGLAPAAHGANRTGRGFTCDGTGGQATS